MRDDFSQKTKNILASRVGWKCSNPSCRKLTCGAGEGIKGVINIGVAAHICAASQGGPRFDIHMQSDERKSYNNGIWLCQSCAKLIDSDVTRYTATLLKEWKQDAEKSAVIELENLNIKYSNSNVIGSENEADIVFFEFHINIDGNIENIDVPTYNKLLIWITKSEKVKSEIRIIDERIILCQNRIDALMEKMKLEKLTVEEEKMYKTNVKVVEILSHEKEYKEIALKYAMRDEVFLAYYGAVSVEKLWKMIVSILNNHVQINYDHETETLLDCFICKNKKRDINKGYHFIVPVNTTELKEIYHKQYGGCFDFQFVNGDVASLGHEIVTHNIAPRFYLFLAEVYKNEDKEILNNTYFLNLFNYEIGLH